jgi:hypothetical protein
MCVAEIEDGKAAPQTAAQGCECKAKNPIDELIQRLDPALLHSSDSTLADLVHRLVALNRLTRATESTEMLLGAEPFLDAC